MGYLGMRVKKLNLTARSIPTLKDVVDRHKGYLTCETALSDNNREAVMASNICIFTTSAYTHLFTEADFKPYTVVCDASAPVNVKVLGDVRDDVFIYHGGVASLPFSLDPGFDIGLASPNTFYGCQLEGLMLGLNPALPCSWGRGNISGEKLGLFLKELDVYPSMNVVFSLGDRLYSKEQLDGYAEHWKEKSHA